MRFKGFNFLEILIVVAVISILVVTFTVSYGPLRIKSRDARRREDLGTIRQLVESYKYINNVYPSTGELTFFGDCGNYRSNVIASGFYPDLDEDNFVNGRYYVPKVVPEFIKSLPVDPAFSPSLDDDKCYLYRSDNGSDYKAIANGTVESYPPPSYLPASDAMNDPTRGNDPTMAVWSEGAVDY